MDDHADIDALASPEHQPLVRMPTDHDREHGPIVALAWYLLRRAIAGVLARWRWTTVRDTGITLYQVNALGKRRVQQRTGGYQPIDRGWLETGRWTPRPSRVVLVRGTATIAGAIEFGTMRRTPIVRPPSGGRRQD